MNVQNEVRTEEVRALSQLEVDTIAGGCLPIWVNGPHGIEGLSPTIDRNDPRLGNPMTWVSPWSF